MSVVNDTCGSTVEVLRLYVALDGGKAVGVGKPELIEGFSVAICGDKLGSRIVASSYPAAWPGIVNANFLAV
jgi:hypothetical protein